MNRTIKFGLASMTKSFDVEATVGDVVRDPQVRLGLDLPDNFRVIDQAADTLSLETRCPACILIEGRSNTKGC